MNIAVVRTGLQGVLLVLGFALASRSAAAPAADPYAYTLYITPIQDPVDPSVDRRYSRAFEACQSRAQMTMENVRCFQQEYPRQDAVLNRVWKAKYGATPAARRPALLAAQRKWIAGRDPFCRAERESYGRGTFAPIGEMDCLVELTIRRTMWLEKLPTR